jgi:isochorismate hydrolase
VYQIFDSEENDGVLIPYNYSNKKLEESVGYISKNHRIQKQVEPNLEMSVLDRNKPISNIRKQILQKVTKAHKNGCYRGYILILTISSPEFYCNKNLLEDFWKNQISNNPFCNLFIIETQNNFDDFQLVMKI